MRQTPTCKAMQELRDAYINVRVVLKQPEEIERFGQDLSYDLDRIGDKINEVFPWIHVKCGHDDE